MTGQMEGEVFLQLVYCHEIALLTSFGKFVQRRICSRDVGRVALVVMQLEEPRRVVRLECAVGVR